MYQSSPAAITKYCRLGGLKIIATYFVTVLEDGSPRSGCQNGWFLVSVLFLAYKRHPLTGPHMVFPQ